MLQHEFESLTGLKINESQYEVINGMYGCSNNQTKQDFCKMFMAMELMSHVDYVVEMKRERAELRKGQVFHEKTPCPGRAGCRKTPAFFAVRKIHPECLSMRNESLTGLCTARWLRWPATRALQRTAQMLIRPCTLSR